MKREPLPPPHEIAALQQFGGGRCVLYEWRVRWKPGSIYPGTKTDARTATFQTEDGARRCYEKVGPEPWKAWGIDPDEPFHDRGCPGIDGIIPMDEEFAACPGCDEDEPRTWRQAFADRPPPVYREIVRREVGPWENVESDFGGDRPRPEEVDGEPLASEVVPW